MISTMLRFDPSLLEGLNEVFAPNIPLSMKKRAQSGSFPQVNMGVTDDSVEVYLFAPGLEASELDVTLEKNLLSISGERKPEEVSNEKESMSRLERLSGRFKRTITLPEDVNPDKTEASYRNGVLHISVAKHEISKPRQIKVEA